MVDHLSRLENNATGNEKLDIDDAFPDEQVLATTLDLVPWFADFANFLACNILPEDLTFQQRKKFLFDVRRYYWDKPYLYRLCADNVIRRCIPEAEMLHILEACHSSQVGGHHDGSWTARKVLQCGYYRPTLYKDAYDLVKSCNQCQRQGNISKRQELPMTPILEVELFDVWSVDFIGPFVSSFGMKYILLDVDYVSKWIEAATLPNNE